MYTFKEYIVEAVNKGKEIERFEYQIGSEKIIFTINYINNEYRLNVEGTDKYIFVLKDKNVINAKDELKDLVNKHGAEVILKKLNKNKEEVELKKNNTDWELFSEYNTSRGSMAFTVYRRIRNNRYEWNQAPRGKKYLSIHMISKEDEVKKEISDTVKSTKLKYVSGWNPETDK